MRCPIWNKFIDIYSHNIEVNPTRFNKSAAHFFQTGYKLILSGWKTHIEMYQKKIDDYTQPNIQLFRKTQQIGGCCTLYMFYLVPFPYLLKISLDFKSKIGCQWSHRYIIIEMFVL